MPSSPSPLRRLVVFDANAAWVRSLFLAMPPGIDVRLIHVGQPAVFRKLSNQSWLNARQWQICGPHARERWIIIPGWNKYPGASTWLAHRAALAAAAEKNDDGMTLDPKSVGIVLGLPQYAGVAESVSLRPRVYYAHDPFQFYGWDREQTCRLEDRMLKATELTFAISRVLRDDLLCRSVNPVFYSPNAVSADFVTELRNEKKAARPDDLSGIVMPIVGCTGQINDSYDWDLLGELSLRMPEVMFVFIGPIQPESGAARDKIDSVLKQRENVRWLGPRPHAMLPDYLNNFDICLNPLKPGPHADRRSPLRLYDYLATGKPVISTDISEAHAHESHVWIGKDARDIETLIRAAIGGERQVDLESRRDYIQRNTWQARALLVLKQIQQIDNRPESD